MESTPTPLQHNQQHYTVSDAVLPAAATVMALALPGMVMVVVVVVVVVVKVPCSPVRSGGLCTNERERCWLQIPVGSEPHTVIHEVSEVSLSEVFATHNLREEMQQQQSLHV